MRSVHDVRVERGAEWLDENEKGWMEKIDLDSLNLAKPIMCVCGQIEGKGHEGGGFFRYVFEKELHGNEAHELGFILWRRDEPANAPDYAKLTTAWKRLIRKRRREERGT